MSKEVADEYASSLADLTVNSKPLINMLTILAEENIDHAEVIVETVEKHFEKVQAEIKLLVLYLVDSIIKNVGGAYTTKFSLSINNMFTRTFKQVDEKIRAQMFKLRKTWRYVFPAIQLYQLDVKVKSIDPAWPIQAQPPQSNHAHHQPLACREPRRQPPARSAPPSAVAVVNPNGCDIKSLERAIKRRNVVNIDVGPDGEPARPNHAYGKPEPECGPMPAYVDKMPYAKTISKMPRDDDGVPAKRRHRCGDDAQMEPPAAPGAPTHLCIMSSDDTDVGEQYEQDFVENKKSVSTIMSQVKKHFSDGQLDKGQYNSLMYHILQLNHKLKLKEAKQRESLQISKRRLKAHTLAENHKDASNKSSPTKRNRFGDINERVTPSVYLDTPSDSQGMLPTDADSDMRVNSDGVDVPQKKGLLPLAPVMPKFGPYQPVWRRPQGPRGEEYEHGRFRGPVPPYFREKFDKRCLRVPSEHRMPMPPLPTPKIGMCQGECPLPPYERSESPPPLGAPGSFYKYFKAAVHPPGLDMLANVMPSRRVPASGSDYSMAEPLFFKPENIPGLETPTQTDEKPPVPAIPLLPNINVNDLFAKLVATGIMTVKGGKDGNGPAQEKTKPEEKIKPREERNIEIKDVEDKLAEQSVNESVVEVVEEPKDLDPVEIDEGEEDDVVFIAVPVDEVVVDDEMDTDDETTAERKERDRLADTNFSKIKVKLEPIDPDDEPVVTHEEEIIQKSRIDNTHATLESSIDGNLQLDAANAPVTTIPVGGIRINISRTLATVVDNQEEKVVEDVSADVELLPPGEEPELEYTLKPGLEGVTFSRQPPVNRGTELSGLCSIM